MNPLISELAKLLNESTPAPWAYRPDKYDDWGSIKGPPYRPDGYEYDCRFHLAQFRNPDACDNETLSKHRAAKTDPWRANAELVVLLRNNADIIVDVLDASSRLIAAFDQLQSTTADSQTRKVSNKAISDLKSALDKIKEK